MAKFSKTGYESGASDLPAIVPVDGAFLLPFGNTPNDVLLRHRAALDGTDLFPSSRIMEAGNRFERAIHDWFEDDFHCEVATATEGFRSDDCNLVASLDGIIFDGITITDHRGLTHTLEGMGVIDFKCPTYKPDDPEALPYHLQLQGQMHCAQAGWAILAQLDRVSCNWTISVFLRHQGMITAICIAVDDFWQHMKDDSDYPPITTTEANKIVEGNRKAAPHDLTTKVIDDDCPLDANDRDQLMNLAEIYMNSKTEEKISKQSKENAQLAICNIMAGVEKIILPDCNINWTTTETKAKEETTKIVPAKPASTSRRFTVKETIND
tara:strand:- start:1775 stop:2746 length:972 start_codon:yes stop_codon:yes gene_type:complete